MSPAIDLNRFRPTGAMPPCRRECWRGLVEAWRSWWNPASFPGGLREFPIERRGARRAMRGPALPGFDFVRRLAGISDRRPSTESPVRPKRPRRTAETLRGAKPSQLYAQLAFTFLWSGPRGTRHILANNSFCVQMVLTIAESPAAEVPPMCCVCSKIESFARTGFAIRQELTGTRADASSRACSDCSKAVAWPA